MIRIKTEGINVLVEVDYDYPANGYFTSFSNQERHEVHAKLVCENLRNHLRKEIERIREEEYQKGWDDHKKRRKKEKWFKGWF